MKKKFTLWVAMLTMATTVFAQSKVGISESIVVTNKTTQETRTIPFSNFSNIWGDDYEATVPRFSLGIYKDDEIEVSYSSNVAVKPSLTWKCIVGSEHIDGGSSLSAKFTLSNVPSDNQAMQVKFDYQMLVSYPQTTPPTPYVLNFENKVFNDLRFYSSYSNLTRELRVKYVHFEDLLLHLEGKPPYVTWYRADNGLILGSGNMDRSGIITFDTKGLTGIFIVKVVVNGVTLPTEKILLY